VEEGVAGNGSTGDVGGVDPGGDIPTPSQQPEIQKAKSPVEISPDPPAITAECENYQAGTFLDFCTV